MTPLAEWLWNQTPSHSRLVELTRAIRLGGGAMFDDSFDHSRFRNDDGSESGASWSDAEDTDPVTITVDTVKRVRVVVQEVGGASGSNTYQLQYDNTTQATGFTDVTTTSSHIRAVASADTSWTISDGDATTSQLVGGSGGFVAGEMSEDGATNSATSFAADEHTEHEFVFQVQSADVADADNIDLRVVNGMGQAISGTHVPSITVDKPSPVLDQQAFRIRANDDAGLNDNGAGDWVAAVNTNAEIDMEQRFRIRFEVEEEAGVSDTDTYELWVSYEGGAYAKVPTTALDWTVAFANSRVEHVDSKQYANGDATLNILTGAGTSGQVFGSGDGVEEGGVTGSITLESRHTEIEFTLLIHRIFDGPTFTSDGDTFDFRVRKADDSVLDTYTNTPRVTANYPAGLIGGVYAENPNVIGPFEDGTNKYVLVEPTEFDPKIMMMKSTDGGDTWAEADGAGRPATDDMEGLHVVQDAANNQLLVFHHPGNSPKLNIFNTSGHATPDDWSTIDENIDAALLDAGDQQITAALRSDGTIVCAYTGDTNATATNFDIWFNIRSFPGETWGTPLQLWNLTNNTNDGVTGVLGDNDNFYVFSIDHTGTHDLLGKTIRGSDDAIRDLFDVAALATDAGTVVDGDVFDDGGDGWQNHTPPQYWNDGANKVLIGYSDSTGDLVTRVITVGTSGSVGSVGGDINDTGSVAMSNGGSRACIANVLRHSNGDFHAFLAIETTPQSGEQTVLTHDVSTDDGANWTTDETVTIRSPFSRINWVRVLEQADGNIGIVYDNADGFEQNNSATGGSNTTGLAGLATGFIWYDEFAVAAAIYPPFPLRPSRRVRM